MNLTFQDQHEQGRRDDEADFRRRALLNWYILKDVYETSGV
jgi:hypothetical protein